MISFITNMGSVHGIKVLAASSNQTGDFQKKGPLSLAKRIIIQVVIILVILALMTLLFFYNTRAIKKKTIISDIKDKVKETTDESKTDQLPSGFKNFILFIGINLGFVVAMLAVIFLAKFFNVKIFFIFYAGSLSIQAIICYWSLFIIFVCFLKLKNQFEDTFNNIVHKLGSFVEYFFGKMQDATKQENNTLADITHTVVKTAQEIEKTTKLDEKKTRNIILFLVCYLFFLCCFCSHVFVALIAQPMGIYLGIFAILVFYLIKAKGNKTTNTHEVETYVKTLKTMFIFFIITIVLALLEYIPGVSIITFLLSPLKFCIYLISILLLLHILNKNYGYSLDS